MPRIGTTFDDAEMLVLQAGHICGTNAFNDFVEAVCVGAHGRPKKTELQANTRPWLTQSSLPPIRPITV
jgi:hypothetical protein